MNDDSPQRPAAPATPLIRDLPAALRPREKLATLDPADVSSAELIAVLLRTGRRGRSVLDIAQNLLRAHGNSLSRLADATPAELAAVPGIGPAKALTLRAAFLLARRAARERFALPSVTSPADVAALFGEDLRNLRQEKFWVLLLDNRHRLLRAPLEITAGTLTSSLAHPREIFSQAIRHSAAALIAVHNHPSGDPAPSRQDADVTRRLAAAGDLVGIPLLDHVVLGGNLPVPLPPSAVYSFAAHRPDLFPARP